MLKIDDNLDQDLPFVALNLSPNLTPPCDQSHYITNSPTEHSLTMKLNLSTSLLLPAFSFAAATSKIWHFTDIHVDPIYVVGADIYAYCNGNLTDGEDKARRWGEPAGKLRKG